MASSSPSESAAQNPVVALVLAVMSYFEFREKRRRTTEQQVR
jgi:hypothetical protein